MSTSTERVRKYRQAHPSSRPPGRPPTGKMLKSPAERKADQRRRKMEAVRPGYELSVALGIPLVGLGPGGPPAAGLAANAVMRGRPPKTPEGARSKLEKMNQYLLSLSRNVQKSDFREPPDSNSDFFCPSCHNLWWSGKYLINPKTGLEEVRCFSCGAVVDFRQPPPSPQEERETLSMTVPINTDSTLAEHDREYSSVGKDGKAHPVSRLGGDKLSVVDVQMILRPERMEEGVNKERVRAVMEEVRKKPAPLGTNTSRTISEPLTPSTDPYAGIFDMVARESPRPYSVRSWSPGSGTDGQYILR